MSKKQDKQKQDNRSQKNQEGKGTTPYDFASYAEVEAEKMRSK
ncbi:hypothetical protein [Fredinandcohnia sp. 179-A 10B2 NHS]